jgi:hypothetical protein
VADHLCVTGAEASSLRVILVDLCHCSARPCCADRRASARRRRT